MPNNQNESGRPDSLGPSVAPTAPGPFGFSNKGIANFQKYLAQHGMHYGTDAAESALAGYELGLCDRAPVAVAGPADARDALLRDALRYRFIRAAENARGDGQNLICEMWKVIMAVESTPEQMDAAIDAALGQQAGGPATTAETRK